MEYKVYTKSACPFCIQAKMLLTRKGIDFEEVDCDTDIEYYRKWIREEANMTTFPVVIHKDKVVGGFAELQDYLA